MLGKVCTYLTMNFELGLKMICERLIYQYFGMKTSYDSGKLPIDSVKQCMLYMELINILVMGIRPSTESLLLMKDVYQRYLLPGISHDTPLGEIQASNRKNLVYLVKKWYIHNNKNHRAHLRARRRARLRAQQENNSLFPVKG